ncbi:hypothetical protein O9929_04825 [Vibrio lentus]|nr:hypothetical protein [Vibrio lentus]
MDKAAQQANVANQATTSRTSILKSQCAYRWQAAASTWTDDEIRQLMDGKALLPSKSEASMSRESSRQKMRLAMLQLLKVKHLASRY